MDLLQETLWVLKEWWLGETATDVARVLASAVVMYVVALWIVRSGKKRFLGRNTVFDALLAFIMGGVLSRAINGGAPLLSTALAGFLLMGLHWLFGVLAMRSERFGLSVKGGHDQLVEDGALDREVMRGHHLTEHDLLMAARQHGVTSTDEIASAYFERNGEISIVPKRAAEVISIDVKEGVQRVEVVLRS